MNLLESIEGRHYVLSILTDYLSENHIQEIHELVNESLGKSTEDMKSFVLRVDAMILLQQYPWISFYLLNEAIKVIKLFNAGFSKLLYSIFNTLNITPTYLPRCFIRITSLPTCDEISRSSIPRSVDIGKFLSIASTVVRAGPIQVLESQREYICKKCKFSIICEFNESDATYTIDPPKLCTNSASGCVSNSFELSESSKLLPQFCKNRQEINVQEQIKYLNIGCMPRTMKVILDDDLVDIVKPGDDIIINGTVIRRWKKTRINEECDIQLVILANEIQIMNHSLSNCYAINTEVRQEFKMFWDGFNGKNFTARNSIISQICPLIYGMYFLKLALALVLCGSENCSFNGMRVRGELHMLLVGDPGTAKSQFLKFAHKVTPRSVLTTGIGSTNAGLTVTAVKESSDWSLEAGALVLADGGICCIDEFTSIRECDKVAIHEAMEQQTISVAKAGIVCKLKTRCSVIAATNPKGNYDVTQSITSNTAIASPLLSRFDLIFLLLDNCDESWDQCVSDFILKHQTFENTKDSFNIEKLKSYFAFVRSNFFPKMTSKASIILEKYYTWMRKSENSYSLDRITMRFLESLIRLSQSHARLMMRDYVEEEDAVVAVAVMESTVYGSTVLDGNQQLPSSFPLDPEEEYRLLKEKIFNKFQISSQPFSTNFSTESQKTSPPISSKPLIKQKDFLPPLSKFSKPKANLNKSRNQSVLDNFQIITQIDNNDANCHRSFIDDILRKSSDDDEINNSEPLSSIPVFSDKIYANRHNSFTDDVLEKNTDDDEITNLEPLSSIPVVENDANCQMSFIDDILRKSSDNDNNNLEPLSSISLVGDKSSTNRNKGFTDNILEKNSDVDNINNLEQLSFQPTFEDRNKDSHNRSIFADSINNCQELTDADFDL